MRRAARADANQSAIIKALQACGATVTDLSAVGEGCPDILVGFRGRNLLMEIKDGAKPPSKRKLTPAQRKWHEAWHGQAQIILSVEQALQAIGAK